MAMKKTILILAIFLATTFANAQITLLHTFNQSLQWGWGIESTAASSIGAERPVVGNYFYEEQDGSILIYNEDCELVKTITKTANANYAYISQGIFTTDNRWAFVIFSRTDEIYNADIPYESCKYYYTIKVMTENGEVLSNLSSRAMCERNVTLLRTGNGYKLVVENESRNYDVYSLPGNGDTGTDIEAPISPRKSSTRKIARNGHVLIKTDACTYTVQGQEVR